MDKVEASINKAVDKLHIGLVEPLVDFLDGPRESEKYVNALKILSENGCIKEIKKLLKSANVVAIQKIINYLLLQNIVLSYSDMLYFEILHSSHRIGKQLLPEFVSDIVAYSDSNVRVNNVRVNRTSYVVDQIGFKDALNIVSGLSCGNEVKSITFNALIQNKLFRGHFRDTDKESKYYNPLRQRLDAILPKNKRRQAIRR